MPEPSPPRSCALRTFGPVAAMLGQEVFVGAVLGLTVRLLISALSTAGFVIAQQLGVCFVTAVDPSQGQQSVIVANFLTMLGLTLVFATDLHHLVIAALNDSYTLFRPGEVPLLGDDRLPRVLRQHVDAAADRVDLRRADEHPPHGLVDAADVAAELAGASLAGRSEVF